MSAEQFIGFFYGNKEEAIIYLEKWIPVYENSQKRHTPKVVERIEKYKRLLSEIKTLNE